MWVVALGDNAEAISAAGWNTVAFDFSPKAIDWARRHVFQDTKVEYHVADLLIFQMTGLESLIWFMSVTPCSQFHLKHLKSHCLPSQALVAPGGGTLLVYTRVREDGAEVDGPPWPSGRKQYCEVL